MRRKHILVGATAAATALLASAAPAIAGDPAGPTVDTIAEGLSSPLQVKAFPGGAMVSQGGPEGGGPGRVTGILDNGESQDLVQDPGAVSGFDYDGSNIAYTSVVEREEAPPASRLKIVEVGPPPALAGAVNRGLTQTGETLANLGRYENRVNPDGDQVYGIRGVRNCEGVPRRDRPYTGIKESNPYAVEAASGGGWFVADAAANSVLHVADSGVIETAMVLPVQRLEITRALAEADDLPRCTVGKTWRYEPVPTDVEEGAAGRLYVTLLPGVPGEGESGQADPLQPQHRPDQDARSRPGGRDQPRPGERPDLRQPALREQDLGDRHRDGSQVALPCSPASGGLGLPRRSPLRHDRHLRPGEPDQGDGGSCQLILASR